MTDFPAQLDLTEVKQFGRHQSTRNSREIEIELDSTQLQAQLAKKSTGGVEKLLTGLLDRARILATAPVSSAIPLLSAIPANFAASGVLEGPFDPAREDPEGIKLNNVDEDQRGEEKKE